MQRKPLSAVPGDAIGPRRLRAAWRVALIYTLPASAWVFASDRLVAALVPDPTGLTGLQTVKGLAFVAVSGALIFVLMRRELGRAERAEAGRRQSEATARVLVENALDVVSILDGEGRIRYQSPAVRRLLGWEPRELVGRRFFELLHPDDAPGVAETLGRELAAPGAEAALEFRWRHRDGSWRIVEGVGRNLRDDPVIAGLLVISRDITERRRAEAELERQRQALYQSEKLAAMGQLLAGVAHELNNPLTVVTGRTALLRTLVSDGPLVRQVDGIEKAAVRCARIVRNFLALARQRPPERGSVDLNRVVQEALELLAYQLRVAEIDVRLDLAGDLPVLWADPHQLHQVVVNLISNAHDALRPAPPPRRLTLATGYDPATERVRLTVADSGPGIPPEHAGRVFEPFFTTKPAGQGTWLGLSLCQSVVENHGGTIHVENAPEGGAVFVIDLPAIPVAGPGPPAAAPAAAARRGTILVVDDEEEVASLLAEMLALDGHQADVVGDGASALERLRGRRYDMILSDVRMPVLDGPQLYHELERHHPDLTRRIVFFTGDTLTADTRRFLEECRVPTVSKPFVADEIRQAVEHVLGCPSGLEPGGTGGG